MNMGKMRQTATRLRRMDRVELLFRLNQEFQKRHDGILSWIGYDFSSRGGATRVSKPPRFFFPPNEVDERSKLLRDLLPESVNRVVEQAEKNLQHRFDLLGYCDLDYGDPIDWHIDLVHGKRAAKRVFYRVPYLVFQEIGDSKVTWELNRHQHFVTLAKAYRLTGEKKYRDEITRQWRHWWIENPCPVGINWASSLELAFRSMAWLWTLHLLDAEADSDMRREWVGGLGLHGQHIERYLSTYFSPNTHLLGEGVALFFLGVLCPELSAANRWQAIGWNIVLEEARRQVQSDGFHFEQSTYYHVYAVDFFLHAVILAELNGIPVPPALTAIVEKMLSALYLLGRSGPPPRLGDDDGGRLFDPRRNRSEHLVDPLATGAVLFNRGDLKSAVQTLREETVWLFGSKGVETWDHLNARGEEVRSEALLAAGFYALTSQSGVTQLVLDCGPLGAQSGGHGHADALSITLQSQGHDLLIDPGTCEYAGKGGDRNLFRGTGMHNTMKVDGLDQAEPASAFSWKQITRPAVETWVKGQNFAMLVASHNGYARLPQPVIHRRLVFSMGNGVYFVHDRAEGQGKHRLEIAWHLAPDAETIEPGVFARPGAPGLSILDTAPPRWSKEMRSSYFSPAYGQKVRATALIYSVETEVPSEISFLLVPWKHPVASPLKFVRMTDHEHSSEVFAYRISSETEEHEIFLAKGGQNWQFGSISSDAEFVSISRAYPGTNRRLILVNGKEARLDGKAELAFTRKVSWAELTVREREVKVHSSDPGALAGESSEVDSNQVL